MQGQIKNHSNAYVDSWKHLTGNLEFSIHQMDAEDLKIVRDCLEAELERVEGRISTRARHLGEPGNSSLLMDLASRKQKIQSLLMKIKKELDAEVIKS